MPGVGVTEASFETAPAPSAFTARTWKVCRLSLVRVSAVKRPAFVPPAALSGIAVQPAG